MLINPSYCSYKPTQLPWGAPHCMVEKQKYEAPQPVISVSSRDGRQVMPSRCESLGCQNRRTEKPHTMRNRRSLVPAHVSLPILDTLQKMRNSQLVNVDNPLPKEYSGLVCTHPRFNSKAKHVSTRQNDMNSRILVKNLDANCKESRDSTSNHGCVGLGAVSRQLVWLSKVQYVDTLLMQPVVLAIFGQCSKVAFKIMRIRSDSKSKMHF